MASVCWVDGDPGVSLGGVGGVTVAFEGIEVDATVDVSEETDGKTEGGIVSPYDAVLFDVFPSIARTR